MFSGAYDNEQTGELLPELPSATHDDLNFIVFVKGKNEERIFSRHATAEKAFAQAVTSNASDICGYRFTACDKNSIPLTEDYFHKTEEHYENMVAHLRM